METFGTCPYQDGFQLIHSTISALFPIAARNVSNFIQSMFPSRTIATAMNIRKIFDSVSHYLVIQVNHSLDSDLIYLDDSWRASAAGKWPALTNSTVCPLNRHGQRSHMDPSPLPLFVSGCSTSNSDRTSYTNNFLKLASSTPKQRITGLWKLLLSWTDWLKALLHDIQC